MRGLWCLAVVTALGSCSDGPNRDVAASSTKPTTTASTSTTTTATRNATTSTTATTVSAPPSPTPPTTTSDALERVATPPVAPPPPPVSITTVPTTSGPQPIGDASVVCSGQSQGPYSVEITWPFSDGVAESASGTFTTYGNYTLAGNRDSSFYVYVGQPALGTNEVAHCSILSITRPA